MSNKKNLLNETQVRQFMKLAKLEPLTPGFVTGLTETTATEAEELEESEELDELRTGRTGALGPKGGTANPGHGRGQGEAADGSLFEEEADPEALEDYAAGDEERGHPEEAAEDELEADIEMEPDVGADEGADQMISVRDLMSAITAALEEVTGQPVDSEIEDAPEAEVPAEDEFADEGDEVVADDELELELQEGDDEDLEEGTKAGDPRKTARRAYEKNESAEDTDDLVEQITKRVAARILKSALAKKK